MNAQAMFLAASVFFFAPRIYRHPKKHTTEDNRAAAFVSLGASILLYFAIR